jgi:LysM repeat protein
MLKLIKECNSVQGLKYTLKCSERTGPNKYNNFGSNVKLNRSPRKIYLYIKGIELLWLQGQNNGKALVKSSKLFIGLNLDPMGSLMRQDQHHTIHEIGFDYIADILDYNVKNTAEKFDEEFKLVGEERMNGRPCFKIEINNSAYNIITHVVLKGENVISIARKLRISEYAIKKMNKGLDESDELKVGSVIKIPSHYAKKVIIHVDQLYYLPIAFKVYDNEGLFESYDYSSMIVNPKFEADEFLKTNKSYGF